MPASEDTEPRPPPRIAAGGRTTGTLPYLQTRDRAGAPERFCGTPHPKSEGSLCECASYPQEAPYCPIAAANGSMMCTPPSMSNVEPVMKLESSLARKAKRPAMSFGYAV